MEKVTRKTEEPVKFGAFGGVFVPNVLTILGVIMFLRTGWVVGNAGLRNALLILVIANSITILTSLSLSAIATNIRVGGGGAYYLVSRSLGLEIGGSVGLPLFLAQAVSVAFYIIGFAESLQYLVPQSDTRLVSLVVLVGIVTIAWVGANLAVKTQFLILGALMLSLASFFIGWSPVENWRANMEPGYADGQSFWTVFAIFFPAVTGVMSGLSMSGDLREPSKAIPRGTIAAVAVTFVVYAAQMVWLSRNAGREELISDALIMQRIAGVPFLIFVGLWAATLSSALASVLAAPRTLQAMAHDRVVPAWLGRGWGPNRDPRVALILSALIAGVCLLAGRLDVIAPVIGMFFLATYGTVNLVAGLSVLAANPSYRPTFRVHWLPCLLGAAGCVAVMFLLNTIATVVSVLVIFGLYSFLKRRQYKTAWGDERSGIWFAVTRLGLLKLAASRQHVRNWRPILLVLVGNPKSRLPMVELANRIEARRGLLFLSQIVTGDWQKLVPRQAPVQKSLEEFIRSNRLSAVGKVILAEDFEHGVSTLLQVVGVGALEPNTVLMGWSDDALNQVQFVKAVKRILELQKSLLVYSEAKWKPHHLEPVIDIWWRARINGVFMLTLAHLLQEGGGGRWRDCRVRVRRIIGDRAGQEKATAALAKMVEATRFDAEVDVIVSDNPPIEVIGQASERSSMCFIGFALEVTQDDTNPLAAFKPVIESLKGDVLLAKNWHDLNPTE
jgi:amino acid transporter